MYFDVFYSCMFNVISNMLWYFILNSSHFHSSSFTSTLRLVYNEIIIITRQVLTIRIQNIRNFDAIIKSMVAFYLSSIPGGLFPFKRGRDRLATGRYTAATTPLIKEESVSRWGGNHLSPHQGAL